MSQRLDVICNDQERSGKNNNSTNCEDLSVPVDRFRNIVNYNWGEAIPCDTLFERNNAEQNVASRNDILNNSSALPRLRLRANRLNPFIEF